MAVSFTINGQAASVDAADDTPLLWVVRENLKLTGTKFGCGSGLCGACTVHVDGKAMRSCQTSLKDVAGKKVTTIEGLSANNSHPLQKAWIAEQVPQCGYCQSGQIMQAAELLAKNKKPSRAADRRAHGRQHLPLWHLSAHRSRHSTRRPGGLSHEQAHQARLDRRFPPQLHQGRGRRPDVRIRVLAAQCSGASPRCLPPKARSSTPT